MHKGKYVLSQLLDFLVRNDFKRLHNIESIGAYYVIRGKTNNDFKPMKWKRCFPPESGIQSGEVSRQDPLDKESKKKFRFFTNALIISLVLVAELYHNGGRLNFSSNGLSNI